MTHMYETSSAAGPQLSQAAATSELRAGVEASGLAGRGGAGFPTAVKLDAAIAHNADLIVNACDGEVGAIKDAWVVEYHLPELIAGAQAVAAATGGRIRYAAHRGSATLARLRAAGLDTLDVPRRYVSSEETALISLAHGGLARPMTKRAPFVRGGQDGAGHRIEPTLVLNAETLLRVAQIRARGADGPAWHRSYGTAAEPGPRLASLTGYVDRPGVVTTQAGERLVDILDAAGGLRPDAEAVVVGGLGGIVLTADQARAATWSRQGLAGYGGSPGAGVIAVLDPRQCPLDVVSRLVTYGAGESAGQCGPCMFGLPAVAQDLHALADGGAGADEATLARLRRRLGLLPGRGACHHPDGVARFAGSALTALAPHVREHLGAPCPRRTDV